MINYLKIHKLPSANCQKWVVSWVEDLVPYREEFDNPVDARYEFRTILECVEAVEAVEVMEDVEDMENVEDVESAL